MLSLVSQFTAEADMYLSRYFLIASCLCCMPELLVLSREHGSISKYISFHIIIPKRLLSIHSTCRLRMVIAHARDNVNTASPCATQRDVVVNIQLALCAKSGERYFLNILGVLSCLHRSQGYFGIYSLIYPDSESPIFYPTTPFTCSSQSNCSGVGAWCYAVDFNLFHINAQ